MRTGRSTGIVAHGATSAGLVERAATGRPGETTEDSAIAGRVRARRAKAVFVTTEPHAGRLAPALVRTGRRQARRARTGPAKSEAIVRPDRSVIVARGATAAIVVRGATTGRAGRRRRP